ncbi:pyruvate, water dikinase regulatory protein [Lucifera butyrica]|uniref:pyruvate, water dikinase regulatory protein n=1 Tax=Lucifera butyrica TaxID=1351585 RepID=UPI000F02DF83|nr:pyruvate, water dikinase regulatory protein [Lucifera butyrica]
MAAPIIYVLSDSIGETAEMVARATASQFDTEKLDIIRIPYIHSVQQIEEVVEEAVRHTCVICHTLVSPDLRDALTAQASQHNIPTVDIMGPMISGVQNIVQSPPRLKPGLMHKLDQEYFKRVEAVEFAVKYDDGKNPWGLLKADMVIIGVSRTSKTPLSMYLAHKKLKVANVPLVPEIPPPEELFEVSPQRVVGLIIDPQKLNSIRSERLRIMGLGPDSKYANVERIEEELHYAKSIMDRIHCPVIDVSNKAIEETANTLLEIAYKNCVLQKGP